MVNQERVYVKTEMFEGWATVVAFFHNEPFHPLQVELDEPDGDGHRMKRVSSADLVRSSGRKEIPK